MSLLSKMDAYLERKNERLRRDSMLGVCIGSVFLFLCLYHLIAQREGLSLNVALTFVFACFTYLWAAWDYLVYKRSASRSVAELSDKSRWEELRKPGHSEAGLPPASVTDQTTRHLDAVVKPPKKMETTDIDD